MSVPASLPACVPACLRACRPAWLSVSLYICLSLSVSVEICLFLSISVCLTPKGIQITKCGRPSSKHWTKKPGPPRVRERTQTIFGMLDKVPQHEWWQEEQCLGSICDPWKVNNRTPSPPPSPPPPLVPQNPQQSRAWKGAGYPRAQWRGLKTVWRVGLGAWREEGSKTGRRRRREGLRSGCQQLADRMCSRACVKWVGGLCGEL